MILLAGLLSIITFNNGFSQNTPFQQDDYQLQQFTVKIYHQVAYLNFHMNEKSDEYAYVLQRSDDNENYKTIYSTNGYASPHGATLMYCHKDKVNITGKINYRLLRVKKCNSAEDGALICDFDQKLADTFVKEITVSVEENGGYTLVDSKK